MKKNGFDFKALSLFLFAAFIASCGKSGAYIPTPTVTTQSSDGSVTITSNSGGLSGKLTSVNSAVAIDTANTLSKTSFSNSITASVASSPTVTVPKTPTATDPVATKTPVETITLVAEAAAPVVDGDTLGATSVKIRGNITYVGYNLVGNPYKGAVQVVDFSSGSPEVISEAIFTKHDINSVTVCGNSLYMATASENSQSAALLTMGLTSDKLLTTDITEIALSSYAANSVRCSSDAKTVVVTHGNTGGLSVFDVTADGLTLRYFVSIADARDVDFHGGATPGSSLQGVGDFFVLTGDTDNTGAKIAVVKETVATTTDPGTNKTTTTVSGAVSSHILLGGSTIAESKSQIEIIDDITVSAVNLGGTKLYDAEDNEWVSQIDPPVVSGLDASLTVANAVTVYGDLVFIGNGEAGVYMGRFDKLVELKPTNFEIIGSVTLGLQQSANDIKLQNNKLIVAAGTGGVKILQIENTIYDVTTNTIATDGEADDND